MLPLQFSDERRRLLFLREMPGLFQPDYPGFLPVVNPGVKFLRPEGDIFHPPDYGRRQGADFLPLLPQAVKPGAGSDEGDNSVPLSLSYLACLPFFTVVPAPILSHSP